MERLVKELVFGLRTLRKNPAFALTAVLTLALGIGASTAIFSVVNAVLLRPLPYPDADRLVLVWSDLRNRNLRDFPLPPADYRDLQDQATMFEQLGAVNTFRAPLTGDNGEPEQIRVAGVTSNLLTLLGARMAVGRNFQASDATPQQPPPQAAGVVPANAPPAAGGAPAGAPPIVAPQAPPVPRLPTIAILSHAFWQRRYGGDRSIVGTSVDLGGGSAEIVGVLAPGFELLFPPSVNVERNPDVYTAMRINFDNASRVNVFLHAVGKLRPGATVAQAQQQTDVIASDLRQRFPIKQTSGMYYRVVPMQQDLVADVRSAILALMGAVTFVLLIACANVANLLLVRASQRERELAVRAALGGTRGRLVRQMLVESVVLAAIGAAAGLLLAQVGVQLLLLLAPDTLPRIDAITIDPMVLGFTTVAGLLAAVAFGVIPAVRASRTDVADVLRATGRAGGLQAGKRVRDGVVTAEVALSFVLLIGCGLMLRSFVALQHVDPGYDPRGVLTFTAPNARLRSSEAEVAYVRTVRERLLALPGVMAVTAAAPLPLDGGIGNARWGTEAALGDPNKFQQGNVHIVIPGYFEAMRTRIIAGRTFTDADNNADTKVIVIDKRLADQAFPNASAVGKRLLARIRTDEAETFEVIGVVAHQRHDSLSADGRPAMFFTDGLLGGGNVGRWAVRTTGDPARLVSGVRAAIAAIDPFIPVGEMRPMQELVDRAMARTRFALALISVFAVIAAVLAAVGLYGVLSTVVRQRTAEIGVRVAFGAPRSSIFQLVIGHGLRLSAIGIGIGLVAALVLTRGMSSMLVGVQATDPVTFIGIAILFVVIAIVASWMPARRAAGLDPTVALRDD